MKVADYISAATALPQPTPQQTPLLRPLCHHRAWLVQAALLPDIGLFFLLDPNVATVCQQGHGLDADAGIPASIWPLTAFKRKSGADLEFPPT